MGFTRYFEYFTDLDEDKFKEFSSTCRVIIENFGVPLEDVTIDDYQVRFNGVDEDGHENFSITRHHPGFKFCKTQLKPYDKVVCGCLYVAKIIFGDKISINQDCEPEDDYPVIQKTISILRENKLDKLLN
jgi:hypothetical protein